MYTVVKMNCAPELHVTGGGGYRNGSLSELIGVEKFFGIVRN